MRIAKHANADKSGDLKETEIRRMYNLIKAILCRSCKIQFKSTVLIYAGSLLLLAGCKNHNHQILILRNLSSEPIYYIISENKMLKDDEITKIRPLINESEIEDEEVTYSNLYQYRVAPGGYAEVLTSEAAGIFVDAVPITSVVKRRYNGNINVFIVKASDLQRYSDQEIINKKRYRYYASLSDSDFKSDMLLIKYQ